MASILPFEPGNDSLIQSYDNTNLLANDEFLSRRVMGGKVSVKMPKQFRRMGKESFYRQFPAKNYQTYEAYTNDDGSMILAFEQLPIYVRPGMILYYQQQYEKQFHAQAGVDLKRCEVIRYHGVDGLELSMQSTNTEEPTFNLMRMLPNAQKLLVVSFQCKLSEVESYKETGMKMVDSIRTHDK